jgi:hypothetical protein
MLKVNDYCFGIFNADNPHARTAIIIYKVTEVINETKMIACPQDTSSSKFPKQNWLLPRTTSHYTKCSSTTIEELKEEFPEVFI